MIRRLFTVATITIASLTVTVSAESIKLAVTDLVGMEELQREFGPFKSELEKATGFEIEFLPVTNRTAALEALRFKKVDFVLAGPAEYVVMQKRADAKVVTGLFRPNYYSLIVVPADSPYYSLEDLKGKKIGMGSVGSTSRHLGPIQLLADAEINPNESLEIVNTNLRLAWEGIKNGSVDAIGMGRSDLENFIEQDGPNSQNGWRVLARSGDLPNDLLMAGGHVSQENIVIMRDAIVENSDALIESIGQGESHVKRYEGMRFLPKIEDKDYNPVRSMYKTAGYPEYSDFIEE